MAKEETIISNKLKDVRCPYQQNLQILCFSDCGRGNAIDCPIWMKQVEAVEGRLLNAQVLQKRRV